MGIPRNHTAEPSLTLVTGAAASLESPIIDIGGGASRLVDKVAQRGYSKVSVLDLSSSAVEKAQSWLGSRAADIDWIAADITAWTPTQRCEVWHDRATFHFMVTEADRAANLVRLK